MLELFHRPNQRESHEVAGCFVLGLVLFARSIWRASSNNS